MAFQRAPTTSGMIIRVTGADATPVIAQVTSVAITGGTGTVTAPTPTPDSSSDLIIVAVVTDGGDGGGSVSWSWHASCAEINEVQSTTFTSISAAATDSSGTYTATASPDHNNGGAIAISIKTAASPDAAVTPAVVEATTTISGTAFTPDAQVNATAVNATTSIPVVTPTTSIYIASIDGTNLCFLDTLGDPILLRGDTSWAIPFNAGAYTHTYEEDIDRLVNNRASQGYNAILIAALGSTENGGPADTGANENGDIPFVGGDFGSLTSAYWTRVDYLVTACQDKGITVLFDAIYAYDMSSGALSSANSTDYQDYGTAIGARYKDYPNIIWWFGGDYFDSDNTKLDSFVTGLTGSGDSHLITIENNAETTSRADIHNDAVYNWGTNNADFNVVYSYNASYDGTEYAWDETSPIPVVHGDGHYYSDGADSAAFSRNWAWWILSSGSRGINAGSEGIWNWNSGSYASVTSETFLVTTLPAICNVFTSFDGWHTLRPDTSSALVTAGRGTHVSHFNSGGGGGEYSSGNSYVTASINAAGTLAVIYIPSSTTITIDEGQMAAGYTATWVDPVTGATTSETTGTTYDSSTPGTNSAGGSDWVLVLQGTTQDASITATAVAASTSIPAPAVHAGSTVTPSAVAATATIPTPAIVASSVISATAVAATATIPTPTVSAAHASIVQTKQGGDNAVSGTLNITLDTATTAGNTLIVIIGNNASDVLPSSVTLGGVSLTADASKTSSGASEAVSFWSLSNIAAGQTAVAITHSGTWSPGITVLETTPLQFDIATAGGTSSAGSQSTFDSGSATPDANSALLLGCCVTFGSSGHTTIAPTGSGTWSAFTDIQEGSFTDVLGASQIVTAAGTVQFTGTLSPSAGDWTALAASYKDSLDANITATAVAATATIPSPTILAVTDVSPSAVNATATIPSPTESAGSTVTPSVISASASITSVSVSTGSTVTPSNIDATANIPSISFSSSVDVAPSVVAGTSSIPTPNLIISTNVLASAVAASTTIPTPTVETSGSASVHPSAVAASATIPAPTINFGTTVSPSAVSATATIPSVGIIIGTLVTPSVIGVAATIPAPTVNTGSSASVSPSAIAAMATIPTPAVSAPASANVTPSVVAASATIPAPGASGSSTVTASVVALSASLPAPTITVSVSIQPSAVSASTTIPGPSITAPSSASITPSVLAASVTIATPTVGVSAVINPSAVQATASIPNPALTTGSTVAPAVVASTANIPTPDVPEQILFAESHTTGSTRNSSITITAPNSTTQGRAL